MSTNSSRPSTPSLQPDHHASHPAHKLLTQAHPNDPELTSKIFTDKILHKPLLLTTATTEPADNRAARRHLRLRKKSYALKHARPKPLSAKEKRELGLYQLRPEECQYEVYKGLNSLWRRYVLEVLGFLDRDGKVVKGRVGSAVTASNGAGLIASADFHGMEVEVVRCVDVGRVGMKGIVVRETRSTLIVVCDQKEDVRKSRKAKWTVRGKPYRKDQDKVRMIMKKGSVFRVVIESPTEEENNPDAVEDEDVEMKEDQNSASNVDIAKRQARRQLIFELHGDQLEIRPIERATKKFKWKPMDYL